MSRHIHAPPTSTVPPVPVVPPLPIPLPTSTVPPVPVIPPLPYVPPLPSAPAPAVNPSFQTMFDKTNDMNSNSMVSATGSIVFAALETGLHAIGLYNHYQARKNMANLKPNLADKSSAGKFMNEFDRFKRGNAFVGFASAIGAVNNTWTLLQTTNTNFNISGVTSAGHK